MYQRKVHLSQSTTDTKSYIIYTTVKIKGPILSNWAFFIEACVMLQLNFLVAIDIF